MGAFWFSIIIASACTSCLFVHPPADLFVRPLRCMSVHMPAHVLVLYCYLFVGWLLLAFSLWIDWHRNLLEEPRGSLVVQMPGWTGLANARVTIFGDIHQLPPELQVSKCHKLIVTAAHVQPALCTCA
jgi:cbb3-type cytochrome oxidase subunit 1